MPELQQRPSGTVTFLFTDIEGSTKRWETHPQAMQAAFSLQEAILRHAIKANGGYAYKMIGDAFQAAFPTAPQALQAAIDAQLALYSERWPEEMGEVRVRMALHSGTTEERGDDYVGPTLNRVARLLSAAHGGQTLLSEVTFGLLRDDLPPSVQLLDMGEHRLKDLMRPEHIFQMVVSDLPSQFPPLKTLDYRPNNLPLQPTPLIGREKELAEVEKLLAREDGREEVRLVTLTGPGGTGKTRLGLQAASDLLDDFPDGVWFVELATIAEPKLVPPTIAVVLGVRETGSTPILDTLKYYLRDKCLLLVLDNFEQVVGAAEQVSQLLQASALSKVLVTSRAPLRLRGEREYAVPPLQLPETRPGHLPPLEQLTQYEAVRLFIERATAVKADFQVTNDNAPAVAEICARLDGLPLAIELAAARVRLFPPQAMLRRLPERLELLTGGARDMPARQQTLRNTIEWSYDLLSEGHRQLFRRMAVFQGGRTLEALEAVCNSEALQVEGQLDVDLVEGVDTLLANSLLQQREGGDVKGEGEPRFWMLETIHEYAAEKLRKSGEAEALERQHALYFMSFAEVAAPYLTGAKQREWLDRLEDDHDNMRAALRWATEKRGASGEEDEEAAEVDMRLAGALCRFWYVRGYQSEGREQLAAALSGVHDRGQAGEPGRDKAARAARALALNGAGMLAWAQGDYTGAQSSYEESLAIRRELGDRLAVSGSLNNLGILAEDQGDYARARTLYEESLAIRRELGNRGTIAASLNNLGTVALEQGDYASARTLLEEALAIWRELGNTHGTAMAINNLGDVALGQGKYVSARTLYEESLAIRRELGDKEGIETSLSSMGSLAFVQGDYAHARTLYEESLGIARELGDKEGIGRALNNLGHLAFVQGDYAHARTLYEESLAIKRELVHKGGIASALTGLGGVAVAIATSAVATRETEGAGGAGGEEGTRGVEQAHRGATVLSSAEALLAASGVVMLPVDRVVYEQAVSTARSVLGEEVFENAWAEGRAMSMEQAITNTLERNVDDHRLPGEGEGE